VKWVEDNPVGVVLASACGLLLLVSAIMVVLWNRPALSGASAADTSLPAVGSAADRATDLGPLSEYRVVTDRPVFDESRRPSVAMDGGGLGLDDEGLFIAGAPEVMLTGVVITLSDSLATLRPRDQGESIIAHEGEPLEGPYVGWFVTDIEPRRVTLSSRDGDSLELDLEVNTRRIAEPPKAKPEPAKSAQTGQQGNGDQAAQAGAEAPLSRAEEIRQRIAERRAELRREQEMKQQSGNSEQRSQYQNAIRNMIQNSTRDTTGGSRKEDEGNNDG
jgi:hypothetical protein